MVVNNITHRILVGLLVLLIFIGCNNKHTHKEIKEETNTNEIVSKVIDCIAVRISPSSIWPVNPPRINNKVRVLTKKDSLKHKEFILDYINEFRIIAIDTSLALYVPSFGLSEKMFFTDDYSGITKAYDSLGTIKIDINKIKLKKVKNTFYFDSIVYLNPSEHIGEYRDYKNIDYRFNFSKIVYNDEKNKAVIRCQYTYEDCCPNGAIFYLRKIKDNWDVVKVHHFLSY